MNQETFRRLRVYGSNHGPDITLSETGENAFAVLQNWHGSWDDQKKFDEVRRILWRSWGNFVAIRFVSNRWAVRIETYWFNRHESAKSIRLAGHQLPDTFLADLLDAIEEASHG